jgi:hypothetical protein
MRLLLATVAIVCPHAALAGESARPADSPECKEITARLIQATDAQFDQVSLLGDNVFLQHRLAGQMVLSCMTHSLTGVSIIWGSAFPPNVWFAIAVKAGQAVTGENTQKLDEGLRKCHRDALPKSTLSLSISSKMSSEIRLTYSVGPTNVSRNPARSSLSDIMRSANKSHASPQSSSVKPAYSGSSRTSPIQMLTIVPPPSRVKA